MAQSDPVIKTSTASSGRDAGENDPKAVKAHFDETGRLPETPVDNRDQMHVHTGQILDKGTNVLQTQQEKPDQEGAPLKIIQAARPTGSDVPSLKNRSNDPNIARVNAEGFPSTDQSRAQSKAPVYKGGQFQGDDNRPEQNARLQAQNETAKYGSIDRNDHSRNSGGSPIINPENPASQAGYTLKGGGITAGTEVKDHPTRTGDQDGAIPGSRSGNPLTQIAENQVGDKVFDISPDGSHWIYVKTRDKTRAFCVDGSDTPDPNDANKGKYTEIHKVPVELKFPPINPKVSQRHLLVLIGSGDKAYQPCEMYFPPDVPNVEIVVPKNVSVHVELTHIDQNGYRTAPYMIDFYSSGIVTPKPLEASPIGFEILSDILIRQEVDTQSNVQPVQGTFSRQAGGSGVIKSATGEAKTIEEKPVPAPAKK